MPQRLAGVVAAIVVAASAGAARPSDVAFPGRNGVIVFTSVRENGAPELYTIDLNGRERQLTANSPQLHHGSVAWSPDGRTIAASLAPGGAFAIDLPTKTWRGLVGGLVPSETVSWSPDGKQFAYARDNTDLEEQFPATDGDIWVGRTDGGDARPLVLGPADDGEPAWSPDSSTIAFSRRSRGAPEVYVVPASGGTPQRLSVGSSPAWAPESDQVAAILGSGSLAIVDTKTHAVRAASSCVVTRAGLAWAPATEIAFTGRCGGSVALTAVTPATGTARRIVAKAASGSPAWSPDRREIAFGTDGALFVAQADGSAVREVLDPPSGFAVSARWSPNGRKLAADMHRSRVFNSGITLVDVPLATPSWAPDGRRVVGRTAAASISIFDTRTRRRTTIVATERGTIHSPAWSPDGRRIAMTAYDDFDGDTTLMFDVARRRFVGRQLNGASRPAWSPDGRWIAFEGSSGIVRAHPDGTGRRLVVRNGADPAWSPDGKKIVFVRDVFTSRAEIYVVNVDGTNVRRLTRNTHRDEEPDWQPLKR